MFLSSSDGHKKLFGSEIRKYLFDKQLLNSLSTNLWLGVFYKWILNLWMFWNALVVISFPDSLFHWDIQDSNVDAPARKILNIKNIGTCKSKHFSVVPLAFQNSTGSHKILSITFIVAVWKTSFMSNHIQRMKRLMLELCGALWVLERLALLTPLDVVLTRVCTYQSLRSGW